MSSTSQNSVLILGSRGRLGSALAKTFTQRGWKVVTQVRASRSPRELPEIEADARNPAAIITQVKTLGLPQIDVVINACNPAYTKWQTEALPLNAAAVEVARALNATLMFPGNVYNFGAAMPAELTVSTAQATETRKGRIRIEMEQQLAAASRSGVQTIVIRAGDFFGCSSGSWFDLVIAKDLARGKIVAPGSLDVKRAWAYVPELAQTFVNVAEARAQLNRFTNIHFTGHTLALREVIDAIERVTAREYKLGKLPWPIIRAFSFAVPMWNEIAELQYLWERPHALIAATEHQSLLVPPTPLDAAIQHALSSGSLSSHQGNTE